LKIFVVRASAWTRELGKFRKKLTRIENNHCARNFEFKAEKTKINRKVKQREKKSRRDAVTANCAKWYHHVVEKSSKAHKTACIKLPCGDFFCFDREYKIINYTARRK